MSHRCPRRSELSDAMNEKFPGPDEYRDDRGLVNSWAPGCTHCGSISGEDFMAFVRAGGTVGGTDKNYKAYLDKDSGTPHETVKETIEIPSGGSYESVRAKTGTGIMNAKFYYQHLSQEQCLEFIDLWNGRKLNHSIYVLPFFMSWS